MPIINALRQKFEGNYRPHPQNAIDEVMIPYKGYVISTIQVQMYCAKIKGVC